VIKKSGDGRAGRLAALIAYYGFFSMFPLLLALVTTLGLLMRGNPGLQRHILDSALSQFPIIGDQIKVRSLSGSLPALMIGIIGSIWAGMAVVGAAQTAMDDIWNVPRAEQPSFLRARTRGLVMLLTMGVGLLVSGALAGLGSTAGSLSAILKASAILGTFLVNLGLF